ncbi:transport protein SFT2-like [Trifolium pratense]|uniref:Transport protein SFT2-like n=2 Tax=Trifolium pratense TaxID=57577 RepID=A0A2K3NSF5_TRIPR|nr:transport protein SFT2-like [Trifolium pratense]
MEGWFSTSTSPSNDVQQKPAGSSSSLLADWNSYASSQQDQDPSNSTAITFDLESAVRSANNTVTGTFSV